MASQARPARIAAVAALLLSLLAATAPSRAIAAELEARTTRAWNSYVEDARRAFLARARTPAGAKVPTAGITASAAREDGIIPVPGGLVHHWVGRAFAPGVTLKQALVVSRDYASYDDIYTSVIRSRVLAHQGDTFRVLMRLEEGDAGITAILDVRSTISYSYPDSRTLIALSNADEIREVENAGEADERLLPAGRDSGYLWRASTFTTFREVNGGLYVEMETVGLSREFPTMLGWLIEPIARRLGRKSVEGSLQEFLAAVRRGGNRG